MSIQLNGISYKDLENNFDANQIISINIYLGAEESLDDDFFLSYPNVLEISIHKYDYFEIPSSLFTCKNLRNLYLPTNNLNKIPEGFVNLRSLQNVQFSDPNSIDFAHAFSILRHLYYLRYYELNGFYGDKIPSEINLMTNLNHLKISKEVSTRCSSNDIIDAIKDMKWLLHLELPENFEPNENVVNLDGIRVIHANFNQVYSKAPLYLSEFGSSILTPYSFLDYTYTRHRRYDPYANYNDYFFDYPENPFFNQQIKSPYRKILFGIYCKNIDALSQIIPSPFGKQELGNSVFVHGNYTSERLEEIVEQLLSSGYMLANAAKKADIQVITPDCKYSDIDSLVIEGKTLALESHLKEFLRYNPEYYLLQEENESLNLELLRLLMSDEIDMQLLAFVLINKGGANQTVLGFLAAIYFTNRTGVVFEETDKILEKYLSREILNVIRYCDLRRSYSEYSAIKLADSLGIDTEGFLLMYRHTAPDYYKRNFQNSKLVLKDSNIVKFTGAIQYFPHIEEIRIINSPNFDLASSISGLKLLPNLKSLHISHCTISLEKISDLKTLEVIVLNDSTITKTDCSSISTKLKILRIYKSQINNWNFLSKYPNLNELFLDHNQLNYIPDEVFSLKELKKLTFTNNQLTEIDDRLDTFSVPISEINLSSNQIVEFKPFLLKSEKVKLYYNKIAIFDFHAYEKVFSSQSELIELGLSHNKLTTFSLGNLQINKLKKLSLSKNLIENIGLDVFKNIHLKNLNISHNLLTEFSFGEAKMTKLLFLDLSNNKLHTIDDSIFDKRYYSYWILDNNFISDIP